MGLKTDVRQRYLLAVSGGIDSVVLLDILATRKSEDIELIVAHFDHGIRPDSSEDARFVQLLAEKYTVPFVTRREELGMKASEEQARTRRYAFLREEAKKYEATIVTAHHEDDCIETIAINCTRGTGWRGLAVLDNSEIKRPLLSYAKDQLRTYALNRRLEWVEDSTNNKTVYLRNRLRRRIASSLSQLDNQQLLELWRRQVIIKAQLDEEMIQFIRNDHTYSRYFFIQIDDKTAVELMREIMYSASGNRPLYAQAERALAAVKTSKPYTRFDVGLGVTLHFTVRTFVVQTP